jgi:hypothetical protein
VFVVAGIFYIPDDVYLEAHLHRTGGNCFRATVGENPEEECVLRKNDGFPMVHIPGKEGRKENQQQQPNRVETHIEG